MSKVGTHNGQEGGSCAVEGRLRWLFAEQLRLRELLERTRSELDQVNGEVLKVQEEFCTDDTRAEEYRRCLERVLGFDPALGAKEIEEALADGETLSQQIEELERGAGLSSSPGTR